MSASTMTPRRATRTTLAQEARGEQPVPYYWRTWFLAMSSSLALWVAVAPLAWLWIPLRCLKSLGVTLWPVIFTVPPLTLPALALVAPIGWLLLIRQPKMSGNRPYLMLWCAGTIYWLLVLEGVRLAYWPLYLGWFALSAYLGVYLPLFVGLSRWAVQRARLPLIVVAPLLWVGLELVRSYFLTGFSLALLAHTQVTFTPLLQVADLGGAYAVSFVVMLVAACLAQMIPLAGQSFTWRPLVPLAATLALVLGYGFYRLNEEPPQASSRPPLRVALLQNAVDTIFTAPFERHAETCRTYQHQAVEIAEAHPNLDLMIWPESMFMSVFPNYVLDDEATLPPQATDISLEKFREIVQANQDNFGVHVSSTLKAINRRDDDGQPQRHIAQLVGTATFHFQNGGEGRYNSALLISPAGQVEDRYDKIHRVMFGEYIPGGDWFPIIYQLTPMADGLTRGKAPEALDVAGYQLAPSICFESTVPQFIRRQVRALEADGKSPDVLVNLTNDGWFWGSGILDLHYNCAIFRAIEHRKPMLVAANTGFSVGVDGSGRVLARGPRRAPSSDLIVDVRADGRRSLYALLGDWPWVALLGAGVGVCAWRSRVTSRMT